jgi:KUP system potassium uptake protein
MQEHKHIHRLTTAGLLVTLGIIYGDIGTSPLYVMKAIVGEDTISSLVVLGGLSCIFWTLTLQTTIKYVIITLQADNKGEGGIFSLFALLRRRMPQLVWPAIIGGAALLADGIITPPISVSSAIEGLKIVNPAIPTIPIVIVILILLFVVQVFGTKLMGVTFGPIMFLWFLMLAVLGIGQIAGNFSVLKAINPWYAYQLLAQNPHGFWLLGAVFLCTTGAEALYSDLGHCGKENIRITWIFVKISLLLNYFGQSAWLLKSEGKTLDGQNPFYTIMPDWFLIYGIALATLAAIIASQALISGSFTLVSEAMRLNIWPKVRIIHPTNLKGQIYVPTMNWFLLAGCIGIVLHFKESSHMEAAYGLAISITMLMTTILLFYFLTYVKKVSLWITSLLFILYLSIEISFLIANLSKFMHGGYVTILISGLLALVMWIWYRSYKIKKKLTQFVKIEEYIPMLKELSTDNSIAPYATHLIYMTGAANSNLIESKIVYSILQKQPKRADVYWFLHIEVTDDPYTLEYKVDILVPDDVVRVEFRLGFKVEQRVNLFFRKVVEDMVKNKEINFTSRYTSLSKRNIIGDFRFVVLEKHLSTDNNLPPLDKFAMNGYFTLKHISLSEQSAFGLDTSSVTVEKVPMIITPIQDVHLKRVF